MNVPDEQFKTPLAADRNDSLPPVKVGVGHDLAELGTGRKREERGVLPGRHQVRRDEVRRRAKDADRRRTAECLGVASFNQFQGRVRTSSFGLHG